MIIKKIVKEEIEELLEYFEDRFGINREIFNEYDFYKSGKEVFIASKSLSNVKLEGIFLESFGMKFATIDKNRKKFKISTDASQIFGKFAKKNFIEIPKEKLLDIFRGFDLINFYSDVEDGYVLFKYNDHILGIGLKNGKFIKNMIPKERRLKI